MDTSNFVSARYRPDMGDASQGWKHLVMCQAIRDENGLELLAEKKKGALGEVKGEPSGCATRPSDRGTQLKLIDLFFGAINCRALLSKRLYFA